MKTKLNMDMALTNMGGDKSLVLSLAEIFLEDIPVLIKQLQLATTHQDRGAMARLAHSIIGLTSNFGVEPATSMAREIEAELLEGQKNATDFSKIEELVLALQSALKVIEKTVCPT